LKLEDLKKQTQLEMRADMKRESRLEKDPVE
jgi:hypothetical protein